MALKIWLAAILIVQLSTAEGILNTVINIEILQMKLLYSVSNIFFYVLGEVLSSNLSAMNFV